MHLSLQDRQDRDLAEEAAVSDWEKQFRWFVWGTKIYPAYSENYDNKNSVR